MSARLVIGLLLALNLLYMAWEVIRPGVSESVGALAPAAGSLQLVIAGGEAVQVSTGRAEVSGASYEVADEDRYRVEDRYKVSVGRQFCTEIGPFAEAPNLLVGERHSFTDSEVFARARQVSARHRAYVATAPGR